MKVFAAPADLSLWESRFVQGAFQGQQLFIRDLVKGCMMELDRTSGWRVHQCQSESGWVTAILHAVWSTGWIKSTTSHVRVLFFASSSGGDQVSDTLSQLPICFDFLYRAKVRW